MCVVHSNCEGSETEKRHESTATFSLYYGAMCVIKFLVLLYLEVVSSKGGSNMTGTDFYFSNHN
jgi:hypothetical protein